MKLRRNKKGFTLAELLVVVAIMAVLVAIAIPIFSSSTKKAEEAVEVANARSCYAEGMSAVAAGDYTTAVAKAAKTYGDKTYTFTYTDPATATAEGTWSIAVAKAVADQGSDVYNGTYTNATGGINFSNVKINGTKGD